MKVVRDMDEWGRVARELGPGSNWHEPDNYGLTGRFDGTDGDLDNAGFWPMDVSRAEAGGFSLGYDRDEHGAPRRGEMAVILSAQAMDAGDYRVRRGRDLAAVNVADLLGWAAQAARVAELELRVRQLESSNHALRAALKPAGPAEEVPHACAFGHRNCPGGDSCYTQIP